jgi:hypothetical protein
MEKIKGRCFTNLDNYECPVREFYRVPNIGERVMCLYKGNTTSLKVVQITHDVRNNEPFIAVQLHIN